MKFRYRQSECLLILGMLISLIVAVNIAGMTEKLWSLQQDTGYSEIYQYGLQHRDINILEWEGTKVVRYSYEGEPAHVSLDELFATFSECNADFGVAMNVYCAEAGTNPKIEVFDKMPKGLKIERYLEYDEEYCNKQEIPKIYIGASYQNVMKQCEYGNSLCIGNLQTVIVGIVECGNLAGYDDTLYLDYQSCNADNRAEVDRQFNESLCELDEVCVRVKGIQHIDETTIEKSIENMFEKNLIFNLQEVNEENNELNKIYSAIGSAFYVILYAFAAINLISVSNLWFQERKQELVVRKMCGSRNGECRWILWKDLLRLLGISTVLFIPIEGVWMWISGTGVKSWPEFFLILAVTILLCILIVSVLVERTMHRYKKMSYLAD